MTLERIAEMRKWMGPAWDGLPEHYTDPPYYTEFTVKYNDLKGLLDLSEQFLKEAK